MFLVHKFFFSFFLLQLPLAYLRTLCPQKKTHKDMRDRKDPRGIKHTYYNGSFFFIASGYKKVEDFPTFNYLFTLFQNMKTKDKTIQILQKKKLKF